MAVWSVKWDEGYMPVIGLCVAQLYIQRISYFLAYLRDFDYSWIYLTSNLLVFLVPMLIIIWLCRREQQRVAIGVLIVYGFISYFTPSLIAGRFLMYHLNNAPAVSNCPSLEGRIIQGRDMTFKLGGEWSDAGVDCTGLYPRFVRKDGQIIRFRDQTTSVQDTLNSLGGKFPQDYELFRHGSLRFLQFRGDNQSTSVKDFSKNAEVEIDTPNCGQECTQIRYCIGKTVTLKRIPSYNEKRILVCSEEAFPEDPAKVE